MKKATILIAGATCLALLLIYACADKSSSEACRYETTLNLDRGNYDAVLASACAEDMQRGAAWFGKAGFEISDVINRMIDANDPNANDLNIYMTALIGKVTETTFIDLDNAKTAYSAVASPQDSVKDAEFYIGLVDVMKSLSLIKITIDMNGDGTISSSCDINGNNKADEVDASACALKAASNISDGTALTCANAAYAVGPVDMTVSNLSGTPTYAQTYSGVIVTLSGTGTASCPADYKKLLYKDTTDPSKYWLATTLSGLNCTNDNGTTLWPCPLESDLDFVTTVDTSLTTASDSISTSITTTTDSDVQQSVNNIKTKNCCTDAGEDPNDPGTCACSSAELAAYLETI